MNNSDPSVLALVPPKGGKRHPMGLLNIPPSLIAIDPGKTCGVAVFDFVEKILHCGDISLDQLWVVLEWHHAQRIAVETWTLYPKMANKLFWHTFPAPEGIGVCRAWATYADILLHRIAPRARAPFDEAVPKAVPKSYHCHEAVAVGLALRKKLELFEEPDWDQWVVNVTRKSRKKK